MAEPITIARPYAEAVFRLADGAGKLAEWSIMLAELAQMSEDERVRSAMGDPNLSAAKVAGLFISILSGHLTGQCENLVRVLADNHRLALLVEIRTQYEALKNEREGVVEAAIQSAFALEPAQLADLTARLEKHTGRKVRVHVDIDTELIGGVRILIGDQVIDASARAQLAALESALKA
ncbi:MAG TPA: F0F1 ATP synthase subunit delta [Burkholderiales bacterium]|nr:F0F1 ATP synthase subunit delta [Burkholderiales bacterium]